MNITVIGATGMVGSAVTDEAVRRGHHVTAVARRPTGSTCSTGPTVTPVAARAEDPAALRPLLRTSDAVVLAIRPPAGMESTLAPTTEAVLDAAAGTGTRALVVGGAGPLRTPGTPGVLLVDDPEHVPAAWRDIALASVAQLDTCRDHATADWTYLSPPAILAPGERTGRYRLGTDTALIGPDGRSRISVEDLAVATVDELERRSTSGHITVGYGPRLADRSRAGS